MGFYTVTDNVDDQYASDINQFSDGLSGNADIGFLKLFAPLAAPPAPTVAVNPVVGNLTGTYRYAVVFVTGYWHGEPGLGTLIVQGTTGYGNVSAAVSPNGQQVNITNIPTGPVGTVARIIGRTKAGGNTFYTLAQINDNTTTSWVDNTPDAGLGAQLNQTNTTGSYLVLPNLSALPATVGPNGTVVLVNNQIYVSNGTQWVLVVPNPATATTPGIVKVGSGILVDPDGTISIPSDLAKIDVTQIWTAIQMFNANVGLGISPAYGLHQLGGGARIQALATPSAPTVTPVGTPGSTTYTYYVVARDRNGNRSLISPATTITNGNATLNATNYNAISWPAVPGAVSYDVLKGNTSTLLANVTGTSVNDTGQVTSAYTPPVRNETADLTVDGKLGTSNSIFDDGLGNSIFGANSQNTFKTKALIQRIDTRSCSFTYDGNGNLTQIVEKDGSTTVKMTTFTYDGNNNLMQIQEVVDGNTITTTLSYDENNNLTGTSRTVS